MKYARFVFISFLMVVGCQVSGTLSAQTFKANLQAGANFSQLDGDQLAGYHQLGLHAGGGVHLGLNDRWAMSIAMLYSQLGSRQGAREPSALYNSIRLHTVEAPVMMHFTDWKFIVGAGLAYGAIFQQKSIDVVGIDISARENYRTHQASGVLSVVFQPETRIGYQFRWTRSLLNMRTNNEKGKFFSKSISFGLVYTI